MGLKNTDGFRFFETPQYPDVPEHEFRHRIAKAQKLMADAGVDCLLLWSRQNIRYFFGYQSTHWQIPSIQPAVGIIPNAGAARLIVPDFFLGTAEQLVWVRDIVQQTDPHQPNSIRELPVDVAKLVTEMGYGKARIGLEMGPLGCTWIPRPLNDIRAFEATLPDAEMVDGDGVIWGCRMIKSEVEVERIAVAVEGHQAVLQALVDEFRPGMDEVGLARVAFGAAAKLGTGWLDDSIGLWGSFRASLNKEPMGDIGVHENAIITESDYIFYCMCFQHKGYQPDSARIFQLGAITPEHERMYELVWTAQDEAEKAIKPGAPANEVFRAMYAPIEDAGLPVLDKGGARNGPRHPRAALHRCLDGDAARVRYGSLDRALVLPQPQNRRRPGQVRGSGPIRRDRRRLPQDPGVPARNRASRPTVCQIGTG